MQRRKDERETMRIFWQLHGDRLKTERSVKKIYEEYVNYAEEYKVVRINEYIFREYIRKNGYCNSCAEGENMCKKCRLARDTTGELREKLREEKKARHAELKVKRAAKKAEKNKQRRLKKS